MADHHHESRWPQGGKSWGPVLAVLVLVGVGGLNMPETRAAARTEPFIAGVHPDRRPEGAPVLETYPKDAAWYERALHGISEPYPYSLKFLEDQGAWYTPFIHPGMTPPYDIRGWHVRRKARGRSKGKGRK